MQCVVLQFSLLFSKLNCVDQAKEIAEIEDILPKSAQLEQRAASLKKDLTRLNAELTQAKFLSTMTTAASMIMMFQWLSSYYGGQVASKVPFDSIFPFKYLVRRGLEEDSTSPFDAGYALVLILSSQFVRCCLNRCMGVSLPSFAASAGGNWLANKMGADPKGNK
jgi:hypothetical protein